MVFLVPPVQPRLILSRKVGFQRLTNYRLGSFEVQPCKGFYTQLLAICARYFKTVYFSRYDKIKKKTEQVTVKLTCGNENQDNKYVLQMMTHHYCELFINSAAIGRCGS